jgi:hypothetical protein
MSKNTITMILAAGAMALSIGQANAQGASRVTHKVNCDKQNQTVQGGDQPCRQR